MSAIALARFPRLGVLLCVTARFAGFGFFADGPLLAALVLRLWAGVCRGGDSGSTESAGVAGPNVMGWS